VLSCVWCDFACWKLQLVLSIEYDASQIHIKFHVKIERKIPSKSNHLSQAVFFCQIPKSRIIHHDFAKTSRGAGDTSTKSRSSATIRNNNAHFYQTKTSTEAGKRIRKHYH
jgi:hypothetical protein